MNDEEDVKRTDANGIPQCTDSLRVLFPGNSPKRMRTLVFTTPQQPSILSQLGIVNHTVPFQSSHNRKDNSKEGKKSQCEESDDDEDSLMDTDSEGGVTVKPTRRQVNVLPLNLLCSSTRNSRESSLGDVCQDGRLCPSFAYSTEMHNTARSSVRCWSCMLAL